ncbi:MAG: UvrD-helicase domain-containing protein [Myxococcales bacterium]|nr:UvrD-helicase domain-containing protein [Myxococcales bacterium]
MRPWWNTSLKIACEFRDHLRKRGLITYNELERLTGQMLSEIARQPALRQQLRGRFTHLLVDEFQDTNQTQVNILNQLRLLCGEDVLRYYVGDAKQSIYRFRHADVNVFTQHIASPQNTDANTLQMVDLPRSRRFAPALADFFHVFFNRILPPTPHWPQQLPAQGDHIGERPFVKPETHALLDLDWHDHTNVLLQSPPADPVLVTTARSHGILFKGDKATPAEPAISLLNSSKEAEQEASEGESFNVDDNELLLEKDPTEEPNSAGDEPSEDKESPSVSRRARQKAARWLRQQFDGEGQFIRNADGKFRRVKASDVAILVRSWNEANEWARTLAKAGIASQVHGGRGLRDVISACDLQNLLHFLNDSENNSAALGVLRGPLFGISDLGLYVLARWPGVVRLVGDEEKPWSDNETEELRKSARHLHSVARMARLNPEKAVQALLRAGVADPQQHDALLSQLTHDAQRLEAGRNALQRVFWRVGREPVAALLRELVFTEHMEAHWRVLPDGEREIANAWRFIAQVESAEGAYPSLPRVIAWLNSDADPNPEGLLEPAGNSVAITTWHGAKGLEWNIVMLTHLNHSGQSEKEKWQFFSARDHNNQLVRVPIYKRQGPGFPETDDPFKTSALVDVVTAADEASETKRLLYVAMTRAREQVVFAGTVAFGMRGNSQTKLLTTTQITEITTQLNANNNKDALDKHLKETPLPAPLALCRQAGHYVAFALSLRPGSVPPSPIEGAWCAHLPFIAESTLKQVDQAADHDVTAWERETPQPLPATLWQGGDARTTLTPSRAGSLGLQLPVFSVEFAPPGKPLRNPPAATAALPIHADDADAPSDEAARQGWDHLAVGTLFHALAERWNFDGPAPGADACTQWLEPLVPSDQAKTLGPWIAEALQRMTLTPLFDEWVEAAREGRLWHELAIDTLYGEHRITGRIDLLWRDAQGDWHLLDYKVTSKGTTESDVQELQSTYAKQLSLYRAALAQQKITLASARLYLVLSGALIAAR